MKYFLVLASLVTSVHAAEVDPCSLPEYKKVCDLAYMSGYEIIEPYITTNGVGTKEDMPTGVPKPKSIPSEVARMVVGAVVAEVVHSVAEHMRATPTSSPTPHRDNPPRVERPITNPYHGNDPMPEPHPAPDWSSP